MNNTKIIDSKRKRGYGLESQWSDDFHHAVHSKLTGENKGYYQDYGSVEDIAKAVKEGFVYDGKYSPFRKRMHGNSSKNNPGEQFVICTQNHDQVGNRAFGDRLTESLSLEEEKLAAALLLLAPAVPLLFMGQEYGEKAPFQYFIDHGDQNLVKAVQEGRKREFKEFGWKDAPDPASTATYEKCKLKWQSLDNKMHSMIFQLYRDLISLRKQQGILTKLKKKNLKVHCPEKSEWFAMKYQVPGAKTLGVFFCFSTSPISAKIPFRHESFSEILNTEDKKYGGHSEGLRTYNKEIELSPKSAIAGFFK